MKIFEKSKPCGGLGELEMLAGEKARNRLYCDTVTGSCSLPVAKTVHSVRLFCICWSELPSAASHCSVVRINGKGSSLHAHMV